MKRWRGFEFSRIDLSNRGVGESRADGLVWDVMGVFLELSTGLPGWEIGRLLSDIAGSKHV